MSPDLLLALAAFALVASITPGPNNLMLMASGANFGVRRTLPHMFGVAWGFAFMVWLVGVGVARLFEIWPAAETALLAASLAYLLYLSWKIATAAPPRPGAAPAGRPFTFLQAAAFQWVNPKAWAMALTAVGVYAADRSMGAVLLVAVVFGTVNLPSVGAWVVLGASIRRLLSRPVRLRAFNMTMAVLLVASMVPALM